MSYCEETENLLYEIQLHTEEKIRNLFHVGFLIESSQTGNSKTFFDLIFTAKYLNGLRLVLSKETKSEESRENLEKEYMENLELLIRNIHILLESGNPDVQNIFKSKYFGLSPECLLNLGDLIADLSLVKNYYNNLKYN